VIIQRAWFVPAWGRLAGNLAMLQGISIDPFHNGPLWSLSYEWWFYVFFFVLVKAEKMPGRRQFWAAGLSFLGLLSALFFLNQASLFLLYFMVWWCGAELARQYLGQGKITWREQSFSLISLSCLSILSLLLILPAVRTHQHLSFIEYPLLFARHLSSGVALVVVGIVWYKLRFFGFDRLLGGFALLAPISYAIYAVHAPVLFAVASVAPGNYALPKIALIWAIILFVAYLLEVPFQSRINRWSGRLLDRTPELSQTIVHPGPETLVATT